MGGKLKVAGFIALGAVAGALTTMQLTAFARNTLAPLPLDELQQLAAVFGMVKSDYVEPVDEKKLITDAIGGMVAGLDPHSQYFDKKSFKEFREGTTGSSSASASRSAWKTASSRSSRRSRARPRSAPASGPAT
jgi:carboxyl-terminal processing protease